jgi:hypothetical protein
VVAMSRTKSKTMERDCDEDDLDRFAGSSNDDSEGGSNDDIDSDDDELVVEPAVTIADAHAIGSRSSTDNDDSEVEGEDKRHTTGMRTVGMANAMAQILGSQAKDRYKPVEAVVLSKTKTPLQKVAEAEKQQEKELREKRRLNREKQLTALHVPLSVATTALHVVVSSGGGDNAISLELEEERTLRRVATRGVVALFNAIAQHQNKSPTATNPGVERDAAVGSKSSADLTKMTKHSFLDMIKTKAKHKHKQATAAVPTTGVVYTENDRGGGRKQQWNALADDFMLNPKKNWDEESSGDDGDDDHDNPSERSRPTKQRRKIE